MKDQDNQISRWSMVKKVVIFQFKLGLDALRDILLSPLSIIVVLIDIVLGHNEKKSYFNQLLKYGRMSDRWINLFESKTKIWENRNKSVDYWLEQVATVVKEQQVNGKLSDSAKAKIEGYMAQVTKKANDKASDKDPITSPQPPQDSPIKKDE